jgi:hypothetical protein
VIGGGGCRGGEEKRGRTSNGQARDVLTQTNVLIPLSLSPSLISLSAVVWW